jgi:hypothetical protein
MILATDDLIAEVCNSPKTHQQVEGSGGDSVEKGKSHTSPQV